MIDLTFHNLTTDSKYTPKFFEKILLAGMRELKFGNKNISISINLVGETRIKKLNSEYRYKNKVTDVLSFPLLDKLEIEKLVLSIPKDQKLKISDLGDIFICLPFAKKEAKRENTTIADKLSRLAVRGFLHLNGYDHEKSEKEAEEMLRTENKILKSLEF